MKSFIALTCLALSATTFAQTEGTGHDTLQTVAGSLVVSKAGSASGDGTTFSVSLNGKAFDQLDGSRYHYYLNQESADAKVGRMLIEDFIVVGFSDPPAVTFYDFRKGIPVVSQVSEKLDFDKLQWTQNSVFFESNGKWFVFEGKRLTEHKPPSSTSKTKAQ